MTTKRSIVTSYIRKKVTAPVDMTPITGISADDALLIDVALTHLLDHQLFGNDTAAARNLRARVVRLVRPVAPIIAKVRQSAIVTARNPRKIRRDGATR